MKRSPFRARGTPLLLALCYLLACNAVGQPDQGGVPHAHEDMSLTPEQIAQLRSRISALRDVPDAAIQAGMRHMRDESELLSAPEVRGPVGLLALGHGFGPEGDEQFRAAFRPSAREMPTAIALGMAMMDSSHIQRAIDQLEAAGASTIVALPVQIGQNTSLIRQWDYILGRRADAAYVDTDRVRSSACIALAPALGTDAVIGHIVTDNLRDADSIPRDVLVLLLGHGPEEATDNELELATLESHAAQIRALTGIADVRPATLQDDAPADVRQRNVARIRALIVAARSAGRRVLVVPVTITAGGPLATKIRRDLAGLDYQFIDAGMVQSPRLRGWIDTRVAKAGGCERRSDVANLQHQASLQRDAARRTCRRFHVHHGWRCAVTPASRAHSAEAKRLDALVRGIRTASAPTG